MDVRLQPSLPPSAVLTLQSVFSAQANTLAVFAAPTDPSAPSSSSTAAAAPYVYLAQYGGTHLERRELKVSTYTVWTSLQVSASLPAVRCDRAQGPVWPAVL